jgi:hypothetical protein
MSKKYIGKLHGVPIISDPELGQAVRMSNQTLSDMLDDLKLKPYIVNGQVRFAAMPEEFWEDILALIEQEVTAGRREELTVLVRFGAGETVSTEVIINKINNRLAELEKPA